MGKDSSELQASGPIRNVKRAPVSPFLPSLSVAVQRDPGWVCLSSSGSPRPQPALSCSVTRHQTRVIGSFSPPASLSEQQFPQEPPRTTSNTLLLVNLGFLPTLSGSAEGLQLSLALIDQY